ncbi:MAG: glycoside hydrolase family 99-like domain-containing protein [Victivallales bacterium]|nr:glycoside hydrolase family 99-like domain-containing protein [Victivallales bacterium]
MKDSIQTLVYYFPNYHFEPRNEPYHGKGWTEWELMRHATPRFPGHRQPKVPLWGYEDEADPEVMARKIAAASDAGVDAFCFDWYWYDGPYLQRALDEGFLKASNLNRLRFCLMWANHDWRNMHPAVYGCDQPILFPWSTTFESVGFVWDYMIERYFRHPQYFTLEGKPFFSLYAVCRFIIQMGGLEKAHAALDLLREKAKAAGFSGVHVCAGWYDNLDKDPLMVCPQGDWKDKLGIDSYTSYNTHVVVPDPRKTFTHRELCDYWMPIFEHAQQNLPAPYYPVATAGWDCSPRTIQSDHYENQPGKYLYETFLEGTPETFGYFLEQLRRNLLNRPPQERLLFINAWNEWTEGSYLEPDTHFGTGFLDAMRQVLT